MPVFDVHYDLHGGFIHDWLVAGPQALPVDDPSGLPGPDALLRIASLHYQQDSGISGLPVEPGPPSEGTLTVGDYRGAWSCYHCPEDHLVDLSASYPSCHYLRSWAYAEVVSEAEQAVALGLAAHGPADVWLNGEHVYRCERVSQELRSATIDARLRQGPNAILVRFEQVAARECAYAMALRISGQAVGAADSPGGLVVRLPTTIRQLERRNLLEQVLGAAYTDRDVFGADAQVVVRWPDDMAVSAEASIRLQKPSGRIYGEAHVKGVAGDRVILGRAYQLAEGPYRILLMPSPTEYYDDNVRVKRELSLWVMGSNRYAEAGYGSFAERRQEALVNAAQRSGGLFSEVAKMALGRWSTVESSAIMEAMAAVNNRQADSDLHLAGLLGMAYRFGADHSFPEALRRPLADCILGSRYWHDEPGTDIMWDGGEGHQILLHACEILAGHMYPDRTFTNSGQTGVWHREKGERLALTWLHQHAASGFGDWDSSATYCESLVALSHLVDLAEAEPIWEMASVVMDKTLLSMAINSYKGVLGSASRRADASLVGGGLLEPTAGIARLLWGLGIYNHHLAGTVSMACLENYELPPIVTEIATTLPEEVWNRERHLGMPAAGLEGGRHEVNKVTYRTPDYMLCSAQDHRPGERGSRERIWQATLGPEAIVFVTHPACSSVEDGRSPGFWLGNSALPRVAQWKDALIAIHRLPADDWLGFTHAYFPVYAFDEHLLRDGWAFARRGEGYLALTAAQGPSLARHGRCAYRELRSCGGENVWLCQMGRAALDGDFSQFQEKVLKLAVAFDGLSVAWETLRGETLSFSWEGPLLRNGQEEPLAGYRHYENPYCVADLPCHGLEVRTDSYLLRLDLSPQGGDLSESCQSLS